jgi:hypothetical protein
MVGVNVAIPVPLAFHSFGGLTAMTITAMTITEPSRANVVKEALVGSANFSNSERTKRRTAWPQESASR